MNIKYISLGVIFPRGTLSRANLLARKGVAMLSRWQYLGWMVIVVALMACAPMAAPATQPVAPAEGGELLVHAAASLTEAFTEIGAAFSAAQPGITVAFNFAGSQQLAQQLAQGAPGDLFASANQRQMQAVVDAGRVADGAPQIFVRNRLVVIFPAGNPAGLATLQDLTKPGIKLVLAAAEVPVGGYSIEFLDKATAADFGPAYKDGVLANVVSYEENVRAVVSKVVLGEADAGIVYSSDVTGDTVDQVGRIDIPDALNVVAAYPLAVLSDAAHPALAQALADFVLGPDGQAILAKHGFIPATQP